MTTIIINAAGKPATIVKPEKQRLEIEYEKDEQAMEAARRPMAGLIERERRKMGNGE